MCATAATPFRTTWKIRISARNTRKPLRARAQSHAWKTGSTKSRKKAKSGRCRNSTACKASDFLGEGPMLTRRHALATMAGALAPAIATQAKAQTNFYAGRTLNIIVGSSTGGYYDTAGRTIARHLARFIPGKPNIVVQNQPGAGGLAIAN